MSPLPWIPQTRITRVSNLEATRNNAPERSGYLDPGIEMVVYRCIQEVLNNVTNHSQAQNVPIELNLQVAKIDSGVDDGGIGILRTSEAHRKGFVLVGMRFAVLGDSMRIGRGQTEDSPLKITLPIAVRPDTSKQTGGGEILIRQQTMRQAS
jgi:glucose-6-phosphate-specific signal transduction histidine kinase